MRSFIIAIGFVLATGTAAVAVTNSPTLYADGSLRYKYGWPGFDAPVVYVQKGSVCTIELNKDESLPPAAANPVIISDTVRWRALTSRGGGARLADGKRVPFSWTISVQPDNDAGDARLIINTTMGRRYMVHLIAVDGRDSRGENLVGFYPFHPVKVEIARRQSPRAMVNPKPTIHRVSVEPMPAQRQVSVPAPIAQATASSTLSSILAAPKGGGH
jgi:hypothetical protein